MTQGSLNRRDFINISIAGSVACSAIKESVAAQDGESGETAGSNVAAGAANAIFIADMSQCQPASAFTRKFEKDRWQLFDYETEEGVKGIMAYAKPEHRCAELTLPLQVSGLYQIYLGINYTKGPYDGSSYGQLEVKLTGDKGFRNVAAETGTRLPNGESKTGESQSLFKAVQEAYWKTADLTGQSLVFRQPREIYRRPELANFANLTYVKLVPLDGEGKRHWEEIQPTDDTRRGAMIYCTGNFTGHTHGTYTFHPTDEQWIRDDFTPYVESDFKVFIFEALRGNYAVYRSKIADVGTENNRWQKNWVDPLAVYTRLAHENGMKILASMRMIGLQYPMVWTEPISWARHYWRMRKFAKLDRDGIPLTGLSIAFPEVREYWLSLLRETLAYGTDGVVIYLNRGRPFVCFEEPSVRSFQEKHGVDPKTIPTSDPRWETHVAGYVTQFLREIRKLVDEKPGRELGVVILDITADEGSDLKLDPIRWGCDVDTWLNDRLVNYLMPMQYTAPDHLRKWRRIGGPDVHLWPDLMPRAKMPHDYAALVKKYYEAGADGYCVWDGERRHQRISEWAGVQRLGHRNMLNRIIEEGPSYYRKVYMKTFAGLSVAESFFDG